MSRMASQTRRISKSLLLLVALAIPLVILAVLLEPLLFPRAAHVRAWSPDWRAPANQTAVIPDFGESKTGAIPLLVVESRPMAPESRARRKKLLHGKLAESRQGPLRLQILGLPDASLAQRATLLSKLPSNCHVVLEISLRDVILETRGKLSPPASAVLETRSGSFPASLWPLRRNGAPKESQRYEKLAFALGAWKQKVEALKGKLVILYLPLPIECHSRQLAAELEMLGLDSSQLQSSRAARRLQDICKQLSLPFVDPTRLLASASKKKKKPVFDRVDAAPFEALYTERAENLILGRLANQGVQPLFK